MESATTFELAKELFKRTEGPLIAALGGLVLIACLTCMSNAAYQSDKNTQPVFTDGEVHKCRRWWVNEWVIEDHIFYDGKWSRFTEK